MRTKRELSSVPVAWFKPCDQGYLFIQPQRIPDHGVCLQAQPLLLPGQKTTPQTPLNLLMSLRPQQMVFSSSKTAGGGGLVWRHSIPGAMPEAYPNPKAPALSKYWALTHLFLGPLDFTPTVPLLRHI